MMRGANLPAFKDVQLTFSAHIRNPETNPPPEDVEPRRMNIYTGLFYRNIESFLASAFPVAKQCMAQGWHDLVRAFVHQHASNSPYFLEISQEFLTFLSERGLDGLPPFLLELCHYEWVELALDVATETLDDVDIDAVLEGTLPDRLQLSPLAQPLSYTFPVHTIGPDHQPDTPGAAPAFLVVYRDPTDKVRFMETNPLSQRLLVLVDEAGIAAAVEQVHAELRETGRDMALATVHTQADGILRQFVERTILLPAA